MLIYNELIILRDKLVNNEVSVKLAQSLYWNDFKKGQRSWHSRDWKERREKVLKDKCEICNSSDTLTIQHRSHPKKYNYYLKEITRAYANNHINNNLEIDKTSFTNHVLNDYEYVPRPLCPKNKFHTPRTRKRTKPKYRCQDCKYEFEEPNFISASELISIFMKDEDAYQVRDKCFISKDKWRNKHSLSNIKYWFQRKKVKDKNSDSIEKKAFILFLEDNIKYLSFENTITACKKCASSYDLHRMELCPKCNKKYKGIQYPSCIQCLPYEKRKAIEAEIEIGRQFREMEKRLEID